MRSSPEVSFDQASYYPLNVTLLRVRAGSALHGAPR